MGSCNWVAKSEEKNIEIQTETFRKSVDKSMQSDYSITTFSFSIFPNSLSQINQSLFVISNQVKVQALFRGYLDRRDFLLSKVLTVKAQKKYSNLPGFIYDNIEADDGVSWTGPTMLQDGSIYIGNWDKFGFPQGKGILHYGDGGICEGYWNKGKLHGKGRRVSANGDVYTGDWNYGTMQGKGILEFSDTTYNGMWKNDKQHGLGTEIWKDSVKYMGNYENGKKNGFGKVVWTDQTSYEGEFFNDVIQGKGKFVWGNCQYNGDFVNGKMHGKGVLQWGNGKIYDGEFNMNLKNGFGTLKSPNGKVVFGQWQNNKKLFQKKKNPKKFTSAPNKKIFQNPNTYFILFQ